MALSPGEKYTWIVPKLKQTKDPIIFYPPFGEEAPESAKVYFADCKPVEYLGDKHYDRDPRSLDSYVYRESDKTNDKEYWRTFTYTFTVEDYQNALKQE